MDPDVPSRSPIFAMLYKICKRIIIHVQVLDHLKSSSFFFLSRLTIRRAAMFFNWKIGTGQDSNQHLWYSKLYNK